nr:MAG TPA: hypothetical protein [Caudoviricetes sp.]
MSARWRLDASHTWRGSPAAWARRADGTIDGLQPRLFSGFRPIANRGRQ